MKTFIATLSMVLLAACNNASSAGSSVKDDSNPSDPAASALTDAQQVQNLVDSGAFTKAFAEIDSLIQSQNNTNAATSLALDDSAPQPQPEGRCVAAPAGGNAAMGVTLNQFFCTTGLGHNYDATFAGVGPSAGLDISLLNVLYCANLSGSATDLSGTYYGVQAGATLPLGVEGMVFANLSQACVVVQSDAGAYLGAGVGQMTVTRSSW